MRRQVELTEAAFGPSGLFNALQDERNRAAVDLADLGSAIRLPVASNAEARALTDEAAEDFGALVAGHEVQVQRAYAPALEAITQLPDVRADVDAEEQTLTDGFVKAQAADEAFTRYSELIDAVLDANAEVTVEIDDPVLRQGAVLSFMTSRQIDVVARLIRHVLVTGIGAG